ncbi:hypothetical protein HWD97_15550 [Ochrobactrum sp. C6C9]|uniref:hypothetical protein n=1 Tax=Ochrobactrum sp. C6C9 TaxID=2736662 RepID=UPI0035303E5E|nr:hypothetical protein [Ochrobactrum sp. C6C9]
MALAAHSRRCAGGLFHVKLGCFSAGMLVAKMAERDMKQRDGAQTESENRMHLVRRAILTGLACLSFGFYSSATESIAQAADGAVVAQTENVDEQPAPATDGFGRTQFILSGDPIVPPRAYSKGTDLPRAQDYDANESGTIYDILFIGIEKTKCSSKFAAIPATTCSTQRAGRQWNSLSPSQVLRSVILPSRSRK